MATSDNVGRPVRELSDEELEQQGKAAHDTRNWVFLNGTAEQFATHTTRMLQLEQEYVRRHPKRTWQGSGGAAEQASELDVLRLAIRGIAAQLEGLLEQTHVAGQHAPQVVDDPVDALLAMVAASPSGRMHKLELHQAAREVGLDRAALAKLYTGEPRLLTTEQQDRVITDAGRARLGES